MEPIPPAAVRALRPSTTIATRLALLLAVAVLPLLALSGWLIYDEAARAHSTAMAAVQEVARDIADDSDAFLARRAEGIEYLARRLGEPGSDCASLVGEYQGIFASSHTALLLVDGKGALVCASRPQTTRDFTDRQWFRSALAGFGTKLGHPVTGRVSGELVLPMTAIVHTPEGERQVLMAGLRVSEFVRLVSTRTLPGKSLLAIVADDGTIMARTPGIDQQLGNNARDVAALAWQMAQREGVATLAGADGVERVTAFLTMPTTGWLVSAGIPTQAVLAPARAQLFQAGLAALAALLAVTLIGARVAGGIRRSIRGLVEAVRAASNGELQALAPESGPAEVGAVAHEFNRMVSARARAERALVERGRQLEAANAELEAFAYSVSHDLRAPLRAIDGFAHAIAEDYEERLDDQGRDYLARVRNAAQRMSELIDDLLALSRATRTEMQVADVDLSDLAARVAAELQRQAPDRHVEVAIAPHVQAKGDPRLLRIVLENLLGNAWKFTARAASARIAFCAERRGAQLECRVTDNGAGFDMAYGDKLFSPFQRLHASADFEGNGIGLATVRRIVARHGGSVRAEGAVGQGASFIFTLPLDWGPS